MSIPECEPVAVFPNRAILEMKQCDNAYYTAIREWLLGHTNEFSAAFNTASVEVDHQRASIVIVKKFAEGAVEMYIELGNYAHESEERSQGFGELQVIYKTEVEEFIPYGYGDLNGNLFEQLDILPEGLGLRLRRNVVDPRTITYIDALGNITTETRSTLKS